MVGKAERLTWHKAWTMVSTGFSISYTSRDPEMAKEVFGVSRELAELVAKATDSQLRHMSGTTVTHFTLRFAPSIIEEILDDSREELTHPVLKKLQQSLQGRGRWR